MAKQTPQKRRVALFGATGTIGRATLAELRDAGHEVVTFGRAAADIRVDIEDLPALRAAMSDVPRCDAVISCLASRNGLPKDAWAVDHAAHVHILQAAKGAGVNHFVLLSAICVQKPELEFQHAKLAFEAALQDSGMTWSIVRPTAYFKSLSGQLNRLRQGKPFLLFGDGTLTACKPISDADLARFLERCLWDPALSNRILPIGGPGPALTPRQQGAALFAALGVTPNYRRVPLGLMHLIIAALQTGGLVSPKLRDKAELAKIGRYYATRSMLVWDRAAGRYDADATPEFGTETLPEFYEKLAGGAVTVDLGDHAVF